MPDSDLPLVKPTKTIVNLPSPVTFEELATQRKLLQEFCPSHIPSLEFFLSENMDLPIFRLDDQEHQPARFRHITSSATCHESIEQCPDKFRPEKKKDAKNFKELGDLFAEKAIELPVKDWVSDGAAGIYCSCRGLPFVLSRLKQWHANIDKHLERIFYQLRQKPERFAIGEADKTRNRKEKPDEQKSWYKPNAYHTYWTLEVLRILDEPRFEKGGNGSKLRDVAFAHRDQLRLWARQQLGIQAALHSAESSTRDSDQLAWSLTILISESKDYQSNLAEQDLIKHAFKCLFSTQEEVGTWRHYAPLFHYPHAGNAYCYVFETFTALLRQALRPGAEFVRNELRNYFPNLIRLWEYAKSTKATLYPDAVGFAWSSGHRNQPRVESWATASVFAYLQALRRLVGMWTSAEALKSLNYKSPPTAKEKAQKKLLERSDIWSRDDLADRLWTMFVNTVSDGKPMEQPDPDDPLIGESYPCSAIFFGPPGTSKTSLVAAIASAIGWKYVELHPSHFVAEGLPNVQHTADQIFGRLMELDHAVVLFDEIDELVRERDIEPDQFGRFLTTSMLPRLAELWKGRKVMYFVATNHIEYFDRAVTRSERFDAIIFMSPPSFKAKTEKLLGILERHYGIEAKLGSDLTKKLIDDAMPAAQCKLATSNRKKKALKSEALPDENVLAKFALLRWDELDDLALSIDGLLGKDKVLNKDVLAKSLKKVSDSKSRNLAEYCRFTSDQRDYERFDASRSARWIVGEIVGHASSPPPKPVVERDGVKLVDAPVGPATNIKVSGFTVEQIPTSANVMPGTIRLRASSR